MRIVSNTGTDRVVDIVRPWLGVGNRVDLASRTLSLFAFGQLAGNLARMAGARLVLPPDEADLDLLGSDADRAARNRLQARWLAGHCANWIETAAEVSRANGAVPQGAMVLRNGDGRAGQALLGSFSFSTDGLGLAPGNPLNLIQASETPEECERLGAWFDAQWSGLTANDGAKPNLVEALRSLAAHRDPFSIYALILHHLFRTDGGELDEERVVRSATGIRDTEVWKRLFKFQRDGVVGAIDKIERFGGRIVADSVGLGNGSPPMADIDTGLIHTGSSMGQRLRAGALKTPVSPRTVGGMRDRKPTPTPMPDVPDRPKDWREQIKADLAAQLEAGGTLYAFQPDGTCIARTQDGDRVFKLPARQSD